MRIGVFGGTFDPVHLGHLIIAEQCMEQARLDQVWFVPSARPPHKSAPDLTPFARRVEMLALAIAGQPAFQIQELERDRPGLSYTVDTLTELRAAWPEHDLQLILGSDALYDLPGWRAPEQIIALAGLLIVPRPAHSVWPIEQIRTALHLPDDALLRLQVVPMPLIEISSRDLRRRGSEGRSIRYFVPRAVECYIETHQLYRKT